MKKQILMIMICALSANLFSQTEQINKTEKRNSVTIGFFQGGGSIVGADFELLVTNHFGIQLGAGLIGWGGGVNFHFKPSIRSSFISLQYWNQGVGATFAQNVLGPNFVYRGKKWFTFQIGLGVPLKKGPALPYDYKLPPVMLMYGIGAYLPF